MAPILLVFVFIAVVYGATQLVRRTAIGPYILDALGVLAMPICLASLWMALTPGDSDGSGLEWLAILVVASGGLIGLLLVVSWTLAIRLVRRLMAQI